MPAVYNVLTTDNPVFASYLFYAAVLTIKLLLMVPLIGRQRFAKKVFTSPEDTVLLKNAKVKFDDADVERVRRAHLNDLENIPIFLIVALGYILTQPNPGVAINLFRIFTAGRIIHTIVYTVFILPQPARALAFGAGYVSTFYMALRTLLYFA